VVSTIAFECVGKDIYFRGSDFMSKSHFNEWAKEVYDLHGLNLTESYSPKTQELNVIDFCGLNVTNDINYIALHESDRLEGILAYGSENDEVGIYVAPDSSGKGRSEILLKSYIKLPSERRHKSINLMLPNPNVLPGNPLYEEVSSALQKLNEERLINLKGTAPFTDAFDMYLPIMVEICD
jgi:hypothetical protein